MDGRNLSYEIMPNWSKDVTLVDIALAIPIFVQRYYNEKGYRFYGKYDINSCYELTNFNNMLVNTYICKIDNSVKQPLNSDKLHLIVLSDDCFVLLEAMTEHKNFGKVVFWSTLFAINDMQINKSNRAVCINFYKHEENKSNFIRLRIANVLFFREALVKRLSNLKIKVEENKLVKGQMLEKRLSDKDIMQMNIDKLEWHINFFRNKILHKEINFYVINTFSRLCSKAIEYYSAKGEDNPSNLIEEMRNLFAREDVQKIMKEEKNP
ncbi:MAG: hypothetical protein MJ252_16030 [archaeon]|nr:hypothetical protein [archaeon]